MYLLVKTNVQCTEPAPVQQAHDREGKSMQTYLAAQHHVVSGSLGSKSEEGIRFSSVCTLAGTISPFIFLSH